MGPTNNPKQRKPFKMVYDWFWLSNYAAGLGQKPHTGAKIQIIESRESIKKRRI